MKKLYFECITTLKFSVPVVDHQFLLRMIPPSYSEQEVLSSNLQLMPDASYTLWSDGFGNICQTGCILYPHNEFIYSISGTVLIDDTRRINEPLHPIYRFPSFYTHTNEEMRTFVKACNLSGSVLEQANQLSHAIYQYMEYKPDTTSTTTTAIEAFATRYGVCQDFAHIFIALARHIGIPTRYANGLPIGHGPTHAWVEVYADGKWIGLDPTHNRWVCDEYIRFCVGRDFLDCALERGIFTGSTCQEQYTEAQVIIL